MGGETDRWAVKPLNVTIFGSVARGDEQGDSDIDLFVVLPTFRSARHRRSFGEQMVELHFAIDNLFHRDLREVELDLEQLERVAGGRPVFSLTSSKRACVSREHPF